MTEKLLFRPQCAGYSESMAQVTEIATFDDLLKVIAEASVLPVGFRIDPTTVNFRRYCENGRNGWDTHVVTVEGQFIGFTNGPIGPERQGWFAEAKARGIALGDTVTMPSTPIRGVGGVLYTLDDDGVPQPTTRFHDWDDKIECLKRLIAYDWFPDEETGIAVSTIFTGIDYSFGLGKPLLWETMTFGGPDDLDQTRYETREEAMAGHSELVQKIGPLPEVAGAHKWRRGDKIDVTARDETRKGEIALVNENGRSVIVVCETDIPDLLTPLLLRQHDDGSYATIFDDSPVVITARAEAA